MYDLLIKYNLITEDSVEKYYSKVRDRDDIQVYKSNEIIFLSRTDHTDVSYYNEKKYLKHWGELDRKVGMKSGLEDMQRRTDSIKYLVSNKKWLDVGSGLGEILESLGDTANECIAVEPQDSKRKVLQEAGFNVYPLTEDIKEVDFDIVTMFHVLEHLDEPIEVLKQIREKMTDNGKIVIEVPHARDFLLSFLDLDDFKEFTLWSEHLILHTRNSLRVFLEEAGFKDITIQGCQRFPLANHLHWLKEKKPGGHNKWSQLRTEGLDKEYESMLNSLDMTDTITAFATK